MNEVEKRCPACGETKPVSEFYRNRAQRDGLSCECKPCQNARNIVRATMRYREDAAFREKSKRASLQFYHRNKPVNTNAEATA